MKNKILLLFLLPAVLTAAAHRQTKQEFGAIRPLATPAQPGSAEPNLSLGVGGRVYLTWIEPGPDSSHVLRFSALDQSAFTAAQTVARGGKGDWFVNWADFPSLIAVSNQHLYAHWLQRTGKSRYAYGVRVSHSSNGGQSWSEPITPHRDQSESEHGFVSMFKQGNQVGVVWLDGRKHAAAKTEAEAEMSLRYTTLAPANSAGADSEIDPRVCDCCQTSAALTARGPLVVYRDRSANEVRDIAVSRFEKNRWSTPRLVHRDNWVIAACPVNGPAVSAQGNRVAVAWFTGANNESRVNVAFSRNAGDDFTAPIRVDDGNPAGRVDVQYLNDNSALVSWLERANDRAEVRVRRVFANGRRGESKTIAASTSERASGFPHMVWRGRDVVFAWTEPGRPSQVKAAILELR